MVPRRSVLVAVLALSVLVPAGVAVASPQPSPVCEACGGEFERAARDHYHVDVTESTLDVYLRANGSARRVVRNRVNASVATYLRDNPAVLDMIVREALPSDRRAVSARVERRTVVVTSVAPDAAGRSFGVLVYDRYRTTYRALWVVNADRFAVHAPDGYGLASDHDGDRTTGTSVAWNGRTGDGHGYPGLGVDDSFDHRTFVAFAPEGTLAPGVRARLAEAASVAPLFLRQFVTLLTPVTVVLGVALAATGAVGVRPRRWGGRRVGTAVAVLGTVVLVATLATVDRTNSFRAVPVALAFGLLAQSAVVHPRLRPDSLREAFLATAGLSGIAAAVVVLGRSALSIEPLFFPFALGIAFLPVELGLFVLLGYARGTGDPASYGVGAAVFLPYVAFAVWELPVFGGFGSPFLALLVLIPTVAVGVLGVPLYCLGVSIAE